MTLLNRHPLFAFAAALIGCVIPLAVFAEPSANPTTESTVVSPTVPMVVAVAPVAVEPVQITFAKRDLERFTARKAVAEADVTKSKESLAAMNQRIQLLLMQVAQQSAASQAAIEKLPALKAARAAAIQAVTETEAAVDALVADAASAADLRKMAADRLAAAVMVAAEADRGLSESVSAWSAASAAVESMAAESIALTASLQAGAAAVAAAEGAVAATSADIAKAAERLSVLTSVGVEPDPAAIRLLRTFSYERPVLACRFAPDGESVFAGLQGNAVIRTDTASALGEVLGGPTSWVAALDVFNVSTEAGTTPMLLLGTYSGQLMLHDFSTTAMAATPRVAAWSKPAHKGHLRCLVVNKDQNLAVTAGNDLVLRVWSLPDGELVKELPGHSAHVYSLAFDPAGTRLFSGDLMGVIKQWKTSDWTHEKDIDAGSLHKFDTSFVAHAGGVRSLEVSPDGLTLLAGGVGNLTNAFAGVGDPTLVHFDLATSAALKTVSVPGQNNGTVWSARWHPSGAFVVATGWGAPGSLWFWKPGEDKVFHEMKLPAAAYDCRFHPDGLQIAVALYNKTVAIYDMSRKLPPPAETAVATPAAAATP